MSELPPDHDLDLPRELPERDGPLVISGVDQDGTRADARRLRDDDEL